MRKIFTIAIFFASSVSAVEAAQQKPNQKPAAVLSPQSLNLNLEDNGAMLKEGNNAITNQEKSFNDLQTKSKASNDESGEAGKFQLKPEFNFVEDESDYNPRYKGDGEEVKLHLNYNF